MRACVNELYSSLFSTSEIHFSFATVIHNSDWIMYYVLYAPLAKIVKWSFEHHMIMTSVS